jgi:hypothetical protein
LLAVHDDRSEGKLCPGAPLFGFSGTFAAVFGGARPPRRGFSDAHLP